MTRMFTVLRREDIAWKAAGIPTYPMTHGDNGWIWILVAKQRFSVRCYCFAESACEDRYFSRTRVVSIVSAAFDWRENIEMKRGMQYVGILKYVKFYSGTVNKNFTIVLHASIRVCDQCKTFRAFYCTFFSFDLHSNKTISFEFYNV